MWIKHTDAADPDSPVATAALRHDDATNGERVTFTDSGKAQVTADVGDALIEQYDAIVPVSDAGDGDTDTDTDTINS